MRFSFLLIIECWFVLDVAMATAQSEPRSTSHSIHGVVADTAGNPIPYAYVFSLIPAASSVSNAAGGFTLAGIPSTGTTIVTGRRIGFAPAQIIVQLADTFPLHIVLTPLATKLTTVEVRGHDGGYDEYLDRMGYYKRTTLNVGGSFIPPEVVERRNPMMTTQLLQDVSGVRVETMGTGSAREMSGRTSFPVGRGRLCAMGLVVDNKKVRYMAPPRESLQPHLPSSMTGSPVSAVNDPNFGAKDSFDDMIPITQVKAIEVYSSATSVPGEFQHYADGCGLIIVWTKYH